MNTYLNKVKLRIEQGKKDVALLHKIYSNSYGIEEHLVIKSSICLGLYNLIEGTMHQLLENVILYTSDKEVPFSHLSIQLQKQYFKFATLGKNQQVYNLRTLESVADSTFWELDYDVFTRKTKPFSGNVDVRKVNEFLELWFNQECIIPLSQAENILLIKTLRNKIAHGRVSLLEALKDITIDELKIITQDVYDFLDNLFLLYKEAFPNVIKTKL